MAVGLPDFRRIAVPNGGSRMALATLGDDGKAKGSISVWSVGGQVDAGPLGELAGGPAVVMQSVPPSTAVRPRPRLRRQRAGATVPRSLAGHCDASGRCSGLPLSVL